MPDSESAPALPASDSQICDAIWDRIGKKPLAEIPTCLGFEPDMQFITDSKATFTDSGVEVTLWLDADKRVAMLNVKRASEPGAA